MQGATKRGSDSGLTLIEVVVALTLLGVVAAAALTFFFRGMQSASHLQSSQSAVAVATQAMEKAHSITPKVVDVPTSTSGLIYGRPQTAVVASFTAHAADMTQTNPAWDPSATARPGGPTIPLSYDTVVSKKTYTVTTLIGTCFRPATASTSDQNCTKADPGASAKMFRVTIVVNWAPGKSDECGGSDCEYTLTSLVDPTVDANWNLTAKPVAYDDVTSTVTGAAGDVSNTLANDIYGFVPPGVNPTTITLAPAQGTAQAVTSGSEIGRIKYTPPTAASGIYSLKYRIKDGAGRTSNEATMVINVLPSAANGSQTLETGTTGTWALPAVGTGLKATITGGTAGSAATISGNTNLVFVAPSTAGTKTVTYTVKDTSGLVSAVATITISVVVPTPPSTTALTIPVNATTVATTTDLNILGLLGLSPKASYSLAVATSVSPSNGGTPTLSAPKTEINWVQSSSQVNQVGVFTFNYTVAKGASAPSAQKTVTVQIKPVATNFTSATTFGPNDNKLVPQPTGATGNIPNVAFSGVTFNVVTQPTCSLGTNAAISTAPTVTGGTTGLTFKSVKWTKGSTTGTCTFTYSITWAGTGGPLTSTTMTATVPVKQS